MPVEENKMLVRRQFDEIWNGGNWATVDELYAPNYVHHDPYNPDQGTGPEGFKLRVSAVIATSSITAEGELDAYQTRSCRRFGCSRRGHRCPAAHGGGGGGP